MKINKPQSRPKPKSNSNNRLSSIKNKLNNDQSSNFISSNALMCIEINAHYLIYIYLLVQQNIIPKSISENVFLFSSQPCENVFRHARALSGVYSTRINFTTMQFLQRVNKLNVLNELKQFEATNNEHKIIFPVHYKIKRFASQASSSINIENVNFSMNTINKIIHQAYDVAKQMAAFVNMDMDLIKNNSFEIDQSSQLTKKIVEITEFNRIRNT